MSRRTGVREALRWARYINHYGHIPQAKVGGQTAFDAISWALSHGGSGYRIVRDQAKHRFGAKGGPSCG